MISQTYPIGILMMQFNLFCTKSTIVYYTGCHISEDRFLNDGAYIVTVVSCETLFAHLSAGLSFPDLAKRCDFTFKTYSVSFVSRDIVCRIISR